MICHVLSPSEKTHQHLSHVLLLSSSCITCNKTPLPQHTKPYSSCIVASVLGTWRVDGWGVGQEDMCDWTGWEDHSYTYIKYTQKHCGQVFNRICKFDSYMPYPAHPWTPKAHCQKELEIACIYLQSHCIFLSLQPRIHAPKCCVTVTNFYALRCLTFRLFQESREINPSQVYFLDLSFYN